MEREIARSLLFKASMTDKSFLFALAATGEPFLPPVNDDLDRGAQALPPAAETEFRPTRPFPKRCANFGNERLTLVGVTPTFVGLTKTTVRIIPTVVLLILTNISLPSTPVGILQQFIGLILTNTLFLLTNILITPTVVRMIHTFVGIISTHVWMMLTFVRISPTRKRAGPSQRKTAHSLKSTTPQSYR